MSGEIVLIRHAETAFAGRFCGHSDPPLNTQGINQLPGLGSRLARWEYDSLYSSDLLRARQTAKAIVQKPSMEIGLRSGLREIFFGEWEGLTWREIETRDQNEAKLWIEQYPQRAIPGGEDYKSFSARVQAEAEFLFDQARHSRVAAVTHAGVIRTILSLRSRVSEQEASLWTKDYGSIVVLSTRGRVVYTSAEVAYA